MVLYPNKLPESERVCSGICTGYGFAYGNAGIRLKYISPVVFGLTASFGYNTQYKPERIDDKQYLCKHSVNHVFSSPTSIINFTSKKPSYDDTRRSGRDNELLQRAQNDL